MPRRFRPLFALMWVSLFSFPSLAQAPPSADTYVTSAQPTVNFGSSSLLPVQAGTTSYVRLNLGALPASASIAKATLRLYVNAVVAPGTFDVFSVDAGWTEKGLNLNNAPALGASATGGRPVPVTASSLNQFILVDITPLAQGWLDGSVPNYGIALVLTTSGGSFSFDSKESVGTGHQPELDVAFNNMSAGSAATSTVAAQDRSNGETADSSSTSSMDLGVNARSLAQGHGTKGYIPIWLNSLYLGNSALFQDISKNLGVGTVTPVAAFDVNGNINAASGYQIAGTDVLTASPLMNGGGGNLFLGLGAGAGNTTGSSNTALGLGAGKNNTTGSNDVYIANSGSQSGSESNTIRIGDPANQTSAYLAGVTGSSTSSGMPVFVDSTGKLGTNGGAVNFSQVVGTLATTQFSGTYNNAVTLANTTNSFTGTFSGNGAGLFGVTSGLSWPIVAQTGDYTIQISDFSTATKYGNFLVLTGTVAHTFKLPNPPPPNGSCVAIGDFALSPIASNTNVFLTVSSNGLSVDGTTQVATQSQVGWESTLYCSDGSGYWRMGHSQTTPSTIGVWLKTVDTGTTNALKTTFVHGMNFGLSPGTMFYILPVNINTSTATLNVNGLGARNIVKFGNQPLSAGDLTTTAYAHVFYDGTNWQLLNPQTVQGTVTSVTATAPLVSSMGTAPTISCPSCVTTPTLSGTTASIGGGALTAGSCASGTATVAGASVGHPVYVSASDGTLPSGLIILSAAVTSTNTVTVQLCATASVTPPANTYNVATQ